MTLTLHPQKCIKVISQAMGLRLLFSECGHHPSENKPKAPDETVSPHHLHLKMTSFDHCTSARVHMLPVTCLLAPFYLQKQHFLLLPPLPDAPAVLLTQLN